MAKKKKRKKIALAKDSPPPKAGTENPQPARKGFYFRYLFSRVEGVLSVDRMSTWTVVDFVVVFFWRRDLKMSIRPWCHKAVALLENSLF